MTQNFRSQLNGFNREDVVNYLDFMNNKHASAITQMTAEADELRRQISRLEEASSEEPEELAQLRQELEAAKAEAEAARAETAELREMLDAAQKENEDLQAQLAEPEKRPADAQKTEPAAERIEIPVPVSVPAQQLAGDELEAYRRAERTERLARERANYIYRQADAALGTAVGDVDHAAEQIRTVGAEIARQLEKLQAAVEDSRRTLLDTAARMDASRPAEE